MVVGIDLMHDCTHDSVSLAVLDDVVVVAATNFLGLLLLSVALHVIARTTLGSVRTCHQKPAVDFLTLGNDKGLGLFLDLVTNLLNQLLEQKLLDKKIYDLLPQDVPGICGALRVLHVQRHQEVLEVLLLHFVQSDLDSD